MPHFRLRTIAWCVRPRGIHVALVLAIASLCHQTSPAQVFDFQHYTVRQGLPSNSINCFYQDTRGNLWVGTNDGLSMFDGRSFRNFGTVDGLPLSSIVCLLEDRRAPGLFWVATEAGVCTFDGKRFKPAGPAEYAGWGISTLFQDHTGAIWLAAEDRLIRLAGDSARWIRPSFPMSGIGQIIEAGDSLLWIHHANGLAVYSFATDAITPLYTTRQTENGMRPMCLDGDGDLWVSRMGEDLKTSSMVRIRGRNIVEERKLSPGQRVDFLVDDGFGNLLAGNYNGVFRIPKESFSHRLTPALTTESGLPDNSIRTGFLDREGNLWLGSATQGISRLSDWSTTHFPLRNIESGHRTSVAAADTADHLWIVSEAGLHEFYQGSDRTWHYSLHTMRDQPLSVFTDRENLLWIAFRNTSLECFSLRYAPNRSATVEGIRRFIPGRDFPGRNPITVLVDRRGRAWYSMGSIGIVVLDRKRARPFVRLLGPREGIPVNYVRTMFEDGGGRIWFGSYHDGVRCFDPGANRMDTAVQTSARSALPDLGIRSFLQDHRGRIWVGTRAGGLGILDRRSWQIVSARDGLPSNTIWTMTEDRHGRIWLGTAVGVVRVDSTGPVRIWRKRELTGPAVFSSGEFRSGQLWFVSSEGVTVYDPELDRPRPVSPTIQITSFAVEGKAFDTDREISLPYDRNSCTIEFASPAFIDPESMRYEYRMVPYDAEWQGPWPGNRVTYEVLPPGKYTFEVQAINAFGIRSSSPARLSFTIIPPLWERWWFIAGAWILATLVLGAGIRRWEMRKIERNMQALEQERAVQRERLRIAQDMHDEIGSALSEIVIIGELARQQSHVPRTIRTQIDTIAERSREALDSIGEIVWATNPRNDALQNFAAYARQYASRYLETAGLRVRIDVPDELPSARISAEERRNLFLAVKEALHNVVKHAGASEVILRMTVTDNRLEILIADDGKGISDDPAGKFGSGLSGMQRRMSDIGGTFSVTPGPGGRGTSIYLILRIAKTIGSSDIPI